MAIVPRLAERIETMRARAQVSGTSGVITVAMRARAHDPLAVALGGPPDSMIYWEQPEHGIAIAAHGAAITIEEADGPDRFERVAERVRDLRSRTSQLAGDAAERTALLVGGFSFFDDESWPGFPTSRLVLPELAFIQRGDRHTWVAAMLIDGTSDSASVAAALEARLAQADDASWRAPEPPGRVVGSVELRDETYVKTVARAVGTIQDTATQKIVVAREFAVDYAADLAGCLGALRRRFSSCVTFAVGSSDGVFCGATPERLVRVDGITVETAAVAGTAPRGSDEMGDQVIADRLLHDPKEQEEHGYVVSEITRRLVDGGCVVGEPEATRVLQLPGIQHLYTPISATAPVGTDVIDVVGALHPTPAVGGLPNADALEWIRRHEPLERGWYAAPIGYCDLAGNGEFRVALRSALIEEDRTRLFAGAGIVEASSPERELEETSLKLGALLPAVLGS